MQVAVVLLGLLGSVYSYKNYTGYKLLEVIPEHDLQLQFLVQLDEEYYNQLQMLTEPSCKGKAVHILVSPDFCDTVSGMLSKNGMESNVMVDNMQQAIELEREMHNIRVAERKEQGISFAVDVFHPLEEIYAYYDELSANHDEVSVETVGHSVENRPIKLLSIGERDKPVQFIDCGIHAGEWMGHAVCLWIVTELITGSDEETLKMRDNFNFRMIMPINPDGYVYTWTEDRHWRKNRRVNANSSCIGVDTNRNFDSHHCEAASTDPCSHGYCGPSPWSEPESATVRDVVGGLNNVVFAWAFHSSGEMWMTPYGYTRDHPKDYDTMWEHGVVGTAAIQAVNGRLYRHGTIADVIYKASGGTLDWYYDAHGIVHSIVFELRGPEGITPETVIVPNAQEVYAGMKAATFMTLE